MTERRTFLNSPTPTPSPGWSAVMATSCQRHDRPAGSACWTMPGEHRACCSTRVEAMSRRP
jgi:hypothetical protein